MERRLDWTVESSNSLKNNNRGLLQKTTAGPKVFHIQGGCQEQKGIHTKPQSD